MECLASGLPVVCSKIRGHTDIIINNRNGFLFELQHPNQMITAVNNLYNNVSLRKTISENNRNDSIKYCQSTAINNMSEIYRQCMKDLN
ncbi:hypothetical protein FACS1894137_16470 [Spirochaetia bacterium]|nr:hypothetical protein FACS1894137_16470 [Spirochaetia bacterium]